MDGSPVQNQRVCGTKPQTIRGAQPRMTDKNKAPETPIRSRHAAPKLLGRGARRRQHPATAQCRTSWPEN